MQHKVPITLEHVFISPGHNYFGKPKDGPGQHPTHDVEGVAVHAGLGLSGDRYFGVRAHFEAQVTFFAAEVFDALQEEFDLAEASPVLTRRNIITRGANLNQLIGQEFSLAFGGGEVVHLEGTRPCSPCAWMDASLAPGAHAFLRGRGGLRARILTDGYLRRGPATLCTDIPLNIEQITAPLQKPRLP